LNGRSNLLRPSRVDIPAAGTIAESILKKESGVAGVQELQN
jgi:hypothetical protein